MARFAFFCLSSSLAHAGRTVRLARALVERGHTCVLLGKPGLFANPHLVPPGTLPVERIWEPELDDVLAGARGQPPKQAEYVLAERMITEERAAIDRLRPDVVVTDNRRTAVVSAEVRKIPSLSLANASMLGPYCAMEPRLDSMANICAPVLGHSPAAVRASPAYAGLTPFDPVPLGSMPLGPAVEKVIRRHGGQRREHVHDLCFGDRTVVLDPPSLMPTRKLPEGARQVGPFFPKLEVPLPPWWDTIDPARPLVYLTFGSTGRSGFAEALKQLTDAGMQCAVTTAHLDKAPPMPGVLAARYLPAWEIMRRAQVVVCHGGTQTVYQALAAGTPVVSLPGHLENAITTVALVQAQLGATLPSTTVQHDPKLLRRTVESVLADGGLKKRVAAAAKGIDENAALAAAVDAAESLVRAR